ncbi:ATP-dependent DNA helicase RecG [Rickettsiales bacterium LUAb2]
MVNLSYLWNDINTLKGVGSVIIKKLNKLGIYRIIDLLLHFPTGINSSTFYNDSTNIPLNQSIAIPLTIIKYKNDNGNRYNKKPIQILANDINGNLVVINFFNYYSVQYIKDQLKVDTTKIIIGKFELFGNSLTVNHPQILENILENQKNYQERIYKTCEGITSKRLSALIINELNKLPDLPEWLTEKLINDQKLPTFKQALLDVHTSSTFDLSNPNNKSFTRLAIDEILAYQINLELLRDTKEQIGYIMEDLNNNSKLLYSNLGFQLTTSQINTIKEIKKDMATPKQMIRIVEGDVGSGKTIVALFSILNAFSNKFQTAFMVPTESLALQHYNSILKYQELLKYNVVLLTGNEKGKKRKEILSKIKDQQIDIVVGTHALFQNDVEFNNLGLVIIDEQHRFGVLQRLALINKSKNPHILMLSATPIPRTLALAYYGDIAISELREKPKNRKPITTKAIAKSRINEIIDRVQKAILRNQKVFWVCPLIEENEKLAFTDLHSRYNELQKYINSENLMLLHGKMKAAEKLSILDQFREAEKGILVSTTVIEVGIDIPDANIMIIEHANQFGLAQLHQLRGRVGRGDEAAACLLIYDDHISQTAKKRMEIMENSTDGFYIAEQDYALRGAGNVLGTEQSGFTPFKIANLEYHSSYIKPLKTYAKFLFNANGKKLHINHISSEDNLINIKLLLHIFNNGSNNSHEDIFYSG